LDTARYTINTHIAPSIVYDLRYELLNYEVGTFNRDSHLINK